MQQEPFQAAADERRYVRNWPRRWGDENGRRRGGISFGPIAVPACCPDPPEQAGCGRTRRYCEVRARTDRGGIGRGPPPCGDWRWSRGNRGRLRQHHQQPNHSVAWRSGPEGLRRAGPVRRRIRRSRGRARRVSVRRWEAVPAIYLRDGRNRHQLLPGGGRPPAARRSRECAGVRFRAAHHAVHGMWRGAAARARTVRVRSGSGRALQLRRPGYGSLWRGCDAPCRRRRPRGRGSRADGRRVARQLSSVADQFARSRGGRSGWRTRRRRRTVLEAFCRIHAQAHLGGQRPRPADYDGFARRGCGRDRRGGRMGPRQTFRAPSPIT